MIVGIVGGGQLARMLALAGYPLDFEFLILDPVPDASAAPLGAHLCGNYNDRALLADLAKRADVVTYEFENVPQESIKYLAEHTAVHPSHHTLAIARDRMREKTMFRELGIPTAPFAEVNSRSDLENAVAEIGLPAVLKTRTLGYDGKGQTVLRSPADLDTAWKQLGSMPLILEGYIPFDREISVIAVRGLHGETKFYPISENTHRDGVLLLSTSRPDDPMQQQAQNYAKRLLDSLNYVGVLALELFQVGETLLANEMAPRVHNSGHWTIEGAETSQFENHLRAILGLPLGATTPVGYVAMVNFIGTIPKPEQVLALPGAHLHDYGKEARPGRKLGHATLRAQNEKMLAEGINQLLTLAQPEIKI
ncbi:5-(carboxyamino)imidazole ribonucleotide synthase [Sulfurirhabdus autotrophica]|uniref:N5-carboxyaminoimidazole ribonucleotide synthase n=1 Tax=Sulfurirhabdus autotrophica TaxID=1706046 RepID=A0A4R3YF99_9PROT|nr:5-(carboxyamino)imidazole ribonucleotide synthase [Sulfurirhabdus autotrophica]TCV89584.1 5-(carboxyamino)imidazole ribonucleotide synthase [Sulfurirhabdus autotrophica]